MEYRIMNDQKFKKVRDLNGNDDNKPPTLVERIIVAAIFIGVMLLIGAVSPTLESLGL